MFEKSRIEVSQLVDPAEMLNANFDVTEVVKSKLCQTLATELVKTYSTTLTPITVTTSWESKIPMDEYKLSLYIFTPEELHEYVKQLQQRFVADMVTMKALHNLDGRIQH